MTAASTACCVFLLPIIAMLHLPLYKCRFDDRGFDDRTMEANYKQIQVIDLCVFACMPTSCTTAVQDTSTIATPSEHMP